MAYYKVIGFTCEGPVHVLPPELSIGRRPNVHVEVEIAGQGLHDLVLPACPLSVLVLVGVRLEVESCALQNRSAEILQFVREEILAEKES